MQRIDSKLAILSKKRPLSQAIEHIPKSQGTCRNKLRAVLPSRNNLNYMAGSGSHENCCFCYNPTSGGCQPRDKSGLHALWTQNHTSSAMTQTESRLLAHLTFKSQANVSAQQTYIISRKPEGKGVLDVIFSIPISALGRQVKKPICSVGSLPLRVPR